MDTQFLKRKNRRKVLSKRQRRTIVDILLTVMLVFEMFYQFTGNTLHELVGFALFLGVVMHLLLSKRWIANTVGALGQSALNRTRTRLAVVAALLTADVLVLAFSSIVISRTLWSLGLNLSWMDAGGIWTILHTASAYGICVLAVVHLAMHWVTMAKSLRIEYNPSRRRAIGYGVNFAAGLGVVALGLNGTLETAEAMTTIAAANEAKAAREGEQGGQASEAAKSERPSEPEATDRILTDEKRQELDNERARKREQQQARKKAEREETAGEDASEAAAGEDVTEPVAEEPVVEEQVLEEEPAYEEPVEEEPSVAVATGICTLCRKQCSLSAPRCDLPYQAGLL